MARASNLQKKAETLVRQERKEENARRKKKIKKNRKAQKFHGKQY